MSQGITITTGARLHFGPLAVRPISGRQFGGVGMLIDEPRCVVTVAPAVADDVIGGAETPRIVHIVQRYRERAPHAVPRCRVELRESLPRHAGFGSGTQLALAVARGLAHLAGEADCGAPVLARRVERGRRSAVGIHGFDLGGLIIDAGKARDDEIGALACRAAVPESWRCLVITPPFAAGASGTVEQAAFERLPPMPAAVTSRLCALALRELLPAVHAADFAAFSAAVFDFGSTVGEYFAPVQGGVFASPRMVRLAEWFRGEGVTGVGQTSWGPTLFAFCPTPARARELQLAVSSGSEWGDCAARIAAPLNQGAVSRPAGAEAGPGRARAAPPANGASPPSNSSSRNS
jgi:beta-RFAP synthase